MFLGAKSPKRLAGPLKNTQDRGDNAQLGEGSRMFFREGYSHSKMITKAT